MKTIVVPVNKGAQSRLDIDQSVDGDLVEIVLDECDFERLWKSGVFHELNESADVVIDDFESESITGPEKLNAALFAVSQLAVSKDDVMLIRLEELFKLAVKFQTGVYFYF